MSEIKTFPMLRHFRAEPTEHVTWWKHGARRRGGRGLSFWFGPLGTSIVAVPLDDRDQAFVLRGRSADFQEVAINGSVTWRVVDADALAARVDFSVDTATAKYNEDPLDKLAAIIGGLAGQLASTYLNRAPLARILADGLVEVKKSIHDGMIADANLAALGVSIVGVAVASVAPSAEVEKALQMPAREKIQQGADEATFQRRALAVDKERAIQENELANQIELARREETLITQRGQNERKRAGEAAESRRIEAEGEANTVRLGAAAQADSVSVLQAAHVKAEHDRIDIYRDLAPSVLLGLAARELGGKLQTIEHLTLSPDALGPLLERLVGAGTRKLEGKE
jgi:hypothetical protein